MRTWNFGKCRRTAVFFRLCLVTVVALSLAMGGISLNPRPAQAIFDISPANITINAFECQSFVDTQLTVTCCTCSNPPQNLFFWLVDTGGGIPAWVNIDQNTGAISGCPPTPSAGAYTFGVQVSELCVCPNAAGTTCTFGDCFPNGAATFPCVTISPTIANVTINVAANIPPCVTAINPTFYPVAWEGVPFTMTLTATGGGAGPLNWTATDLPVGLTVTDAALGIIGGTPAPGTCGLYTVTATVTDTSLCTDPTCCPPISRPFIFIVDCWANYLPIFYYTTACDFTVEIGPGLTQGQTNLLIDGTHEATLVGGQSQGFTSVPCESHLVMVDQTVQVSNTRFSVIGSNMKTVTDTDNFAYFDYAQEVYIQTASEPSGAIHPPGTGFYALGSYFSSTAPGTIETDIQNGKKLVFREWGLPDGSTFSNHNLGFTVNQGGTAVAKYDTYYQLILHSDYPGIDERSFEPAGSTATWNLSLHAVPVEGGFWRFLGVTQTPVNSSGSQLINGPTTVEILWRPNYLPAIIAIVIILLVIAGLVYLIYRLRSKPAAKPAARTVARKAPSRAKKRVTRKRTSR